MAIPPRVSREEFQRDLQSKLIARGWSDEQRDKIAMIMRGDLDEAESYDEGIDAKEAARAIRWMRENKGKHNLSDTRINELEVALQELI